MSIDYNSFLQWSLMKEPTLKVHDIDPLSKGYNAYGISEYTYVQTKLAFEDACNFCAGLKKYLRASNYRTLIFNYALHIAITSSSFQVKRDDDGEVFNEPKEVLQKLYASYGVAENGVGVISSVSSGGSSTSVTLPKSISDGDLETSYLLSTPYGKQVEIIQSQLKGLIL